jgi:hypothetical protein
MRRHGLMVLCALTWALYEAGAAPAAPNYFVTDLGITCPSYSTVYGSFPLSVNNSGQRLRSARGVLQCRLLDRHRRWT